MDALSDLLRVVGLTGGVFLEARFTAPWCVIGSLGPDSCKPYMAPPAYLICFHYIVAGECRAKLDDGEEVHLAAGDVVIFPGNDPHKLGSNVVREAVEFRNLIQPAEGTGVVRVDHGGGGDECQIVCGYLGGDTQLQPLIATLPKVMRMTVRDTPGGDWIAQSFHYGAQQLADAVPGAATIMAKMAELLFVEAVRRYLTTMPPQATGFLAALRDPAVGKALSLLHTQLARDWTSEALADAVNLSRSTFAERFSTLVGQPPMKYLTSWRMQVAAQKLRQGQLTIGQIAFDIGYESEAAFTRAFKREIGVPPATWRRQLH